MNRTPPKHDLSSFSVLMAVCPRYPAMKSSRCAILK